ncbi:MAG TPA: enoyl-CoA hydratase [Acidimicrobiales bacterium]|nr:enoyl-CoA hydratase [Acidimicrobiales bacterium]
MSDDMSDDVVRYEVADGVATLTLNRPDRLNAYTEAMGRRYFDLLDAADADPDVRVIVVTGAGRGFCAGADMDMLQGIGERGTGDGTEPRDTAQIQALRIRKPLIAAINGPCAGIGMVTALMCDVRFAAAGAKLTTAFSRRGLIAEHGMSWILPRLVGPAVALDLLLSARVVLAEEALEMGLVNRVVAPDELLAETLAYARDLADNVSPLSMAIIKQQVYGHLDAGLDHAYSESSRLMVESLGRDDFREGVASFVEKRPPSFPPLTPAG